MDRTININVNGEFVKKDNKKRRGAGEKPTRPSCTSP